MSDTSMEIPGLKDAVGLHRVLHGRLHLPRSIADVVVRTVKFGFNPRQSGHRRRIAREIGERLPPKDKIPESSGYRFIAPGEFAAAQAALDTARARFANLERDGSVEAIRSGAKKQFLLSVLAGCQFLEHPEILSFMVSRPVVDLAAAYMGAVPVLSSARLWWTPPNDSLQQSQLYHRDGEDDRQLKFFFNLLEVTEDAGPLTFLPADDSAQVKRRLGYVAGKLDDEIVAKAAGSAVPVRVTGPIGSGIALDTSRCLHYGSRRNTVGRLILMFQFTSYYAPKSEHLAWADGIDRTGLELDDVQKLVLGLA